jgi:hypothetical protein
MARLSEESWAARVRLPPPAPEPDGRPVEELAAQALASGVLPGAPAILSDQDARERFGHAVATGLWDGERVSLAVGPGVHLEADAAAFGLALEHGAGLDGLYHPLASLLPVVGDDHCVVDTAAWPGARFHYLHRQLAGPQLAGVRGRRKSLLRYLARTIVADGEGDALGRRFVEPGVGRSYLVDFVYVDGSPEYRDFSVTGVGLTPFSRGGFFFSGPHIDGHMPLVRALHRRRLTDALREAGCRVPVVAAIAVAPGLEHTMPDRMRLPAALMVRGFRCVLRVKQLDPLANILMSAGAWSPLQRLLEDGHWERDGSLRGGVADGEPADAAPFGEGPCTCLIPSFFLGTRPGRRCQEETSCRRQRMAVMRGYAGRLVALAARRLTLELGRDPDHEPVGPGEYARWFAETLGAQLAAMRSVRFLHDYRPVQTEWDDPYDLLNSLTDTNVTLLAELADLDTGVLVDRGEFAWLEALRISHSAWDALREGYDELHANEVRLARGIAETVAFAADPSAVAEAARGFDERYQRGVQRTSFPVGGRA